MPALEVFRTRFFTFSTRPFAGDDLQIVCIIIGLLRSVQFICLVPWLVHYLKNKLQALDVWINGVPYWCPQYPQLKNATQGILFVPQIWEIEKELNLEEFSFFSDDGPQAYGIFIALAYLGINISWLCMLWSAASIGTPTEPDRRDKYLRPLIIFQLIAGICCPVVLLATGINGVQHFRSNNYQCGYGVPPPDIPPDETVFFHFFAVLMVTYGLELLFWPATFTSNIIRCFKQRGMFQRRQEEKEYKIQYVVGIVFRCLQCMSCGKAGGKDLNKGGELKDFAVQFMELANYETEMDIVLSDVYIGLHMLARDQQEHREKAIKLAMKRNEFIRNLTKTQPQTEAVAETEERDPFPSHLHRKIRKRASILVLQHQDNSEYQVCERDLLLQSNEEDKEIMQELAHYSRYAHIIYSHLRNLAIQEFGIGIETTHFARSSETLFETRYRLSSLDCDHAILSYASFLNSSISTPYAILVDNQKKTIIITIRGTISIEDMVVDLQYKPAWLEKVGAICGSNLKGHCCHKGILARSKWLYNDVKKSKVLKTLYCETSPYKEYGLVVCGHSLGAGCASLLAIMLRAAFPSIRCYAYEPPGGLLDEELARKCEAFIVSTVRQDDMIPRISHQNFDSLRDCFFEILPRIKVSKIQAFQDIRTPWTGASIKHRNSKVLRARTDVPTDTVFYKRLEQFRLERASAAYEKLYLPGKIIHLLDPGEGRPHIPYYSSRHYFDHIVMSKTMSSDHSCKDLVEALQKAQLSGCEGQSIASFKLDNSLLLRDEKEEDAKDFRLFMLCSNPHGRLPILLTVIAVSAVLCSILSVSNCQPFFKWSTSTYLNMTEFSFDTSFGLFSYRLMDCATENCTEQWFTESPYCVPYSSELLAEANWLHWAQIFYSCQISFAIVSLLLLSISTCYKIRRKTWIAISLLLLCSTLFQGLVLIVLKQCDGGVCRLRRGAALATAACCLYFLTAVGAMFFATKKIM